MTGEKVAHPQNTVRVGLHGTKFLYVDIAKHLLHDGKEEVKISALGKAINDAVSVVEMLKDQQMVIVSKIATSRGEGEGAKNSTVDRIEFVVEKAPGFDEKYDEQQKIREAKKREKEETENVKEETGKN